MKFCPVLWHELHKLLECWTSLSSAQGEALRALLQLHVPPPFPFLRCHADQCFLSHVSELEILLRLAPFETTPMPAEVGFPVWILLLSQVEEWLLYGTFGGVLNERTIEWLIVALVVTWSRACYERLSIALAQSPSSAATVSSRDAGLPPSHLNMRYRPRQLCAHLFAKCSRCVSPAKTLFTAEQKQLLHKMLLLLGPPDRQVASCDADPSSRGSVVLFWEIADLFSPLMEETYLIGAPDIGSTSQRQVCVCVCVCLWTTSVSRLLDNNGKCDVG
jgi:hypothetical protein